MAREKKVKLGKHGFEMNAINFVISGIIDSIKFDNNPTKSGREQNKLSIGVKTTENNIVYVDFKGMVKDDVYLYSKTEKKSKKVSWVERNDDHGTYEKMGFNYALTMKANETDFEYDAVATMKDIYKVGDKVRVIGKIESSVTEDKKVYTNILGNSIYFSSNEFNFEAPEFEEDNKFFGKVVITGNDKQKDDDGNKFLAVTSKVIAYSGTEPFSFNIKNEKLAMNFAKLKDYTAISVEGKIVNLAELKEVESDDDGWGSSKVIQKSYKKEFDVYYADKDSIDKETFTSDVLLKIDAEKNAKQQAEEDFGTSKKKSSDEENIDW